MGRCSPCAHSPTSVPRDKASTYRSAVAKPGIQRVQALSDISRSVLCCQQNLCTDWKSAQYRYCTTRRHPYHSPNLHPGPWSSVGMQWGTHTHTQTAVTTIHFASAMSHAKCNESISTAITWSVTHIHKPLLVTECRLRLPTADVALLYIPWSGFKCHCHTYTIIPAT